MERLTKKFTDGGAYSEEVEDLTLESVKSPTFVGKAIDKLAEYEDLEEQGLLKKFPCKIGDTVYLRAVCECVIAKRECGAIICPFEDECESEECNNGNERLFKTNVESIFDNGQGWHFTAKHIDVEIPLYDIGRNVFLSEDEVKEKYDGTTIMDIIEEQPKASVDDGWIPCSSGKMPMEHDSIFADYKGTRKWNDAMFEKISDEVNITVADENGNSTTTHAHTVDGKWKCDLLKWNKTCKVIAWQPLPAPYQPKGE